MLEKWDEINHFLKHLISLEDLEVGTYLGEYNERIKGGLKSVRKMCRIVQVFYCFNYSIFLNQWKRI